MTHPTQILMHNPQALRLEYRLDDQQLILWWSPRAGRSCDCVDRNFSNRDDHLTVFQTIELPGYGLDGFAGCDYDAYHCVLKWDDGKQLHLALRHDAPVALVWASEALTVDVKSQRYDAVVSAEARRFHIRHDAPGRSFDMLVGVGAGGAESGSIRTPSFRAPERSVYAQAQLAAEQLLAISVGLAGEDDARGDLDRCLARTPDRHLEDIDAALLPIEAQGRITAPGHQHLETLRRTVVRGLHSMIDESGAFRASIKAIYYLIWVRDAGFSFPYQAAAGWPHKLEALCELLLANPTTARGEGVPLGRMFGQLINRDDGKYEEDGAFYVIWVLFTYWTQTGNNRFNHGAALELLQDAVDWVERYIWDEDRGLFGEHFADETPSLGARDHGWDYAIGKPLNGTNVMRHGDQQVVRSYDTYINLIMHSAYTMLAAMSGDQTYTAKAAHLWKELAPFFQERNDGLPTYGELHLENGERVLAEHWGPAGTVYVWALSMPCFAPVDDWDTIRQTLLDAMMAKPRMHWINGICSTLAAVDPYIGDEAQLLGIIDQVADETNRPGPYLPMGGAMPEKFDAPQGNLYHDIRPQGFAMGAWLGAWSSLGVRRLPYGLALRPTNAFTAIDHFPWRGQYLHFGFSGSCEHPRLRAGEQTCEHSLQIPDDLLAASDTIAIEAGDQTGPLLIRSSVHLHAVTADGDAVGYRCTVFGLSELVFANAVTVEAITDAENRAIEHTTTTSPEGLGLVRFTATGAVGVRVFAS